MVRKFRTEYNSKNLRGFCKEQKVSYTKMLHCIRDDISLIKEMEGVLW